MLNTELRLWKGNNEEFNDNMDLIWFTIFQNYIEETVKSPAIDILFSKEWKIISYSF